MIRPDVIYRRFKKSIGLKAVSIVCLSVAFACLLLVLAYLKVELSYDRFHANANRIVRLIIEPKEGLADARVYGSWTKELPKTISGIEAVTLIAPVRQSILSVNNQSFKLDKAYFVDSLFFKVFSFTIKEGNKENPFPTLNSLIVSEGFAHKYFGTGEVIGKSVTITSRDLPEGIYTIAGIMNNMPSNSHFTADVILLRPKDFDFFFYTYLLLQTADEIKTVPDKLVAYYRSQSKDTTDIPRYSLQPITDIHLHSNKVRELERNGSYQSLVLLVSAVVLVLIIALINLMNSSRVLFLLNRNYYILKRTHGATIGVLILEELIQGIITAILIVLIGFWMQFYLGKLFSLAVFAILDGWELLTISLAFIAILLVVMVLPVVRYFVMDFFTSNRNAQQLQLRGRKSVAMRGFIIAQVAISIFVIALSIGLSKQMGYVLGMQLGGKTEGIIVISNQPAKVIKNFDRFKEELLHDSRIIAVSAAMEPPAGAIRDRALIDFEGEKQENPIDLICVDGDFFSFFNLNTLAGTMLPRYPYTFEWEQKSINASMLARNGVKPVDDIQTPAEYSDCFLINRSALAMLNIKTPEKAIGKRIRLTSNPVLDIIPGGRIVGVVDDFKYTSMYEKERPLIIMQRRLFISNFLVRYEAKSTAEALEAIRNTWQKVNPEYPLSYETIQDTYYSIYFNEFNTRRILGYFSLLSLLISSLGLAVMMSFFIRSRFKEIGIRKVNGASTLDILVLLNKNLVVWVLIAFCIATPLAYYAMSRWLQNFAYQTSISWWIFIGAGTIALLIALLIVSGQTIKTARMNPVESIKYE